MQDKLLNPIQLLEIDPEKVADEIGSFVVRKLLEMGKTGAVLGLSGGVDSTSTAAILQRAFLRHNQSSEHKLELLGLILPSHTNHSDDETDARSVAESLNIRYECIEIHSLVDAHRHSNPEAFSSQLHLGNMMSRIRANVLSTKAACENKIVAGTGNRDEDFGIGYYTLFGDGAVHLSPIANLPKRLVRQMAAFLGFEALAERTPTAGLEPDQSDFKDLGYSYDLVELVTEGLNQGLSWEELHIHPQVQALINRDLAEYQAEFSKEKFLCSEDLLNDLEKRNRMAKYKMEIIHPPAAPITAFLS